MDKEPIQIPIRIAGLIIGFINNSLTELEKDELDEWVDSNDHNLEIFEQLLDWERISPIEPEKFLDKYHELMELWVVSGWLAKKDLNILSNYELDQLINWMISSPEKIELLQQLKSYHNKELIAKKAIQVRKN